MLCDEEKGKGEKVFRSRVSEGNNFSGWRLLGAAAAVGRERDQTKTSRDIWTKQGGKDRRCWGCSARVPSLGCECAP